MIVCYFGDSLTLGFGDETGLGWPGRIGAAQRQAGLNVTTYNLGVRKDVSLRLQHRWRTEAVMRKMDDMPLKLVFSFGAADVLNGVEGEQTLAAGVGMLNQAREMGEVLVVGPPPVADAGKTEKITALSVVLEELCARLDIPFVSVIGEMRESEVYGLSLVDGDGVHPTGQGYGVAADQIMKNEAARKFFGLE